MKEIILGLFNFFIFFTSFSEVIRSIFTLLALFSLTSWTFPSILGIMQLFISYSESKIGLFLLKNRTWLTVFPYHLSYCLELLLVQTQMYLHISRMLFVENMKKISHPSSYYTLPLPKYSRLEVITHKENLKKPFFGIQGCANCK